MKINEVEAAVGVTKKNIRFYEEEGLISPRREPGNGYRSYSEADVERLRRIKLLRKLDVPLAEIRQMLEGECTLALPFQHGPPDGTSVRPPHGPRRSHQLLRAIAAGTRQPQ